MKKTISWQSRTTPRELHTMLQALGEVYPLLRNGARGINVSFEKTRTKGHCEIEVKGRRACVKYCSPAQVGRAIGTLMSGLARPGNPHTESTSFEMFGIMLDCSRNAVMTVDHVKLWLRRLTLLGYNMVMLYTEDTYELSGEPWFGYKRGPYSTRELKEIDAYAAKLNIEVIPCIQTLGHLEQILKYPAYTPVKDTSSVMMVGEKATYTLIEKMISHWKKTFRTSRIHIGMDETHDLGRGRYLDKNGYRHGFDLFNEHLAKVAEICRKHGMKPIIWSDMYFRLGCKSGLYYDTSTVIPPRVVRKIPKQAQLVYWDYYHNDKAFYLDWIDRHRKMGKEPLVGSGIWTWNKYWYDHRITEACAGPCIDACREAKVQELFFTQWGDNGAYCDHDSAFAGMAFCAEKAYGTPAPKAADLEKRFATVCGGSYAAHILAGEMHGGIVKGFQPNMWDDPIFETHLRSWAKGRSAKMKKCARAFKTLAGKLARHKSDRATGNLDHAFRMAAAFAKRYDLAAELLGAYKRKDKNALRRVRRNIPDTVRAIGSAADSFREMWMSHNKPEGLEVIQARFGMLEARYHELHTRLGEYMKGDIDRIAELEYKCPGLVN